MTNITSAQIKEEQSKMLNYSNEMDQTHFSIAIRQDCKISQLGFPNDTKFNSALLIINILDKSFVKGNIQNLMIDHCAIPFLSKQDDFYLTYKIKNNELKKLYLCSQNFQTSASKKEILIPNETDHCTSIFFYLDFGHTEQLIIIDPFNINQSIAMIKNSNGTLGTIIKNILLTNNIIDYIAYKNISVGSLNEK